MYNLVIVPNNSANFGVGHYKTVEAAKDAQHNVHERMRIAGSSEYVSVTVTDDYGTIIDIEASSIAYTAIIDVQKKSEASIDAKLAEAKATKGFNEKLMGDKELQLLFRFMQAAQPQPQVIQMQGQNGQDNAPQPN